jgi:hypothetical protein
MEEEDSKTFRVVVTIVIFCLLLVLIGFIRSCDKPSEPIQSLDYQIANDSIAHYRDELNRLVVENRTLTTASLQDFLNFQQKEREYNQEITRLQKLVKEFRKDMRGGGVAIVTSSTSQASGQFETRVDTIEVYPTYRFDYDFEGWIWGNVVARPDFSEIEVNYKDELDILVKDNSVFVRGNNPFNQSYEVKSFRMPKPKEKRFGIGPAFNVGLNNNFSFNTSVGIGIQYSLIRF